MAINVPPGRTPGGDANLLSLRDGDRGLFVVRTVTATYYLDLDDRAVLRMPTYPSADAPHRVLTAALVRHFDLDGVALRLVQLEHCEVGSRLRAQLLIDGVVQPLRSTPVKSIQRAALEDS